jgi:O-antigen/teichoic acid export membrane protein
MRFLATLSGVVLVVMCLSSRTLIVVLYGERFLPAVAPMLILLPGTMFFLLGKVATQFLGSRGLPEVSIGTLALATCVNVILSWLLIPGLGIQGAAMASTLANLVLLISLMVVMRTRYGIRWYRCLWLTRADCRGILKQLHWKGNRVREPQGGLSQVQ